MGLSSPPSFSFFVEMATHSWTRTLLCLLALVFSQAVDAKFRSEGRTDGRTDGRKEGHQARMPRKGGRKEGKLGRKEGKLGRKEGRKERRTVGVHHSRLPSILVFFCSPFSRD
jgi:hypothetical protein